MNARTTPTNADLIEQLSECRKFTYPDRAIVMTRAMGELLKIDAIRAQNAELVKALQGLLMTDIAHDIACHPDAINAVKQRQAQARAALAKVQKEAQP